MTAAGFAALGLLLGAQAQAQKGGLADAVLDALGGAARLEAVETVETTAETIQFSAMYNAVAGGPPIHLSNSEVNRAFQPATGRFRRETRLDAFHPFVETFHFREAFDGRHASRAGPADYRGDGAQMHGVYLGALLKRLWLAHPQWLLTRAERIEPVGMRTVRGRELPSLSVTAHGEHWIVSVDPESDLPRAVSVQERHGYFGTIPVQAIYQDWREVDGIKFPFRLARYNDGTLVRRVTRIRVALAAAGGDDRFRLAPLETLTPVDSGARDWGWRLSHWFLGRAAMGRGSETDLSPPIVFNQLGEGLYQIAGSSHHSLLVVGETALAVIDAPFYPARSRQVLKALGERWPDKPVRRLVLTHHHLDHSGGLLPYIEAGAELVIPQGNAAFYRMVLEHGANVEAFDLRTVARRARLPGLGRTVELLRVPNPHSDAMLVAYLPAARLLFVTDLFSPGRPTEAQNTRSSKALFHAIKYYDLDVERIVGGHGAPSAPLEKLEDAAR